MKTTFKFLMLSSGIIFFSLGITAGCATAKVATTPAKPAVETETLSIDATEGGCVPKWGSDSIQTVQKVSLYTEFFKQNNYHDAMPHWRYVFENAPGARQSTFVDGAKMFKDFIQKTKDESLKQKYIDTLIMIYDKRMECFGVTGEIIGRQAIEMMNYRPENLKEYYEKLEKSVKMDGNKTKVFILYPYAAATEKMQKSGALTIDQMLEIYFRLVEIIDFNLKSNPDSQEWKDTQKQVDEVFGGYLKCDDLKVVMQKQYDAAPDNREVLENIFKRMKAARCATDPLFVKVTEKLFKLEPDAEKARILAYNYYNQGNFPEAEKYFKEAIKYETDNNTKADYYMELGRLRFKADDYPGARSYYQQAASVKPNWGEPYLAIGDLYRGSGKKCGPGTGWDSQVVTWPAIDMYEKAKSVDPSVANTANQKINDTKQYMPSQTECFFRSLKEGDSYKVNCWINETTIVRYGPEQ